ncbi:GNAT family N-acetyltransferase [Streptomyces sp. NPDC058308]|uniref:GNAT family N-acetyltransferase n=1 Tax=Streptomyces sp. NPDC058308 TaxID=3346440 RepID=UPI0036E9221A
MTDESLVRSAAVSVTAPRTWMKMPAEPEDVEHWLSPGWVVAWEETGHLMAIDLTATDLLTPEGYIATVQTVDDVVYVRVLDAVGELAAQGQMALVGDTAVVDRVMTTESHRRKGLGGFVMRSLTNRAVEHGADMGVLGATDAGRALYETLGWKKHSTIAECIYRP